MFSFFKILSRVRYFLITLVMLLGSNAAYTQPSAPGISASDVDSDCFYQINFNAPASTPSNYDYELYEKVNSSAWPSSPTVTRSTALGNIPPFYYVRVDKNIGTYTYRVRICLSGTTSCSSYSNEVAVPVSLNCAGLVSPTVSMATPSGLVAGQTTTLNATASTSSGSITSVEFYLGGTLIGTDYAPPYSMPWTPPAAGNMQVRAVANASTGAVSLTNFISVTVATSQIPPSVFISAPANGTNYAIGSSVPLAASASDSDGSITSVAFYANNNLVAVDNSSPYQITSWYPVAGTHDIKAIATDNAGLSTTSATIRITVGKPPAISAQDVDDDCYFTLSLNAPANVPANQVYELYEKLSTASAWPSLPVITRSTGTNPPNAPPFRVIRADQAPGTYQYQSRICIAGACGPMSDVLSVLVKPTCASLVVPSVSITHPVVNQVYPVGQPITIRAAATTTQGSIQSVTFNLGGQTLGIDTSAPYEISWTPPTAGDYLVEAVAEGSNGGTKSSGYIGFKAGTVIASSSSSLSSTPVISSSSISSTPMISSSSISSTPVISSSSLPSSRGSSSSSSSAVVIQSKTIRYTYDALGRLTFVEDSQNGNRDYDYDKAGNRLLVSTSTANDTAAEPVTVILPAPTGLYKSLIGNCAWRATWNPVSGAAKYLVKDTTGVSRYVTTTFADIDCPSNNSSANMPNSVQACDVNNVCGYSANFN
jgi:YD repeat-containing protein